MDKATRLRWAVLLSALTATIVAIVYPTDNESEVGAGRAHRAPKPIAQPQSTAQATQATQDTDPTQAEAPDPFAPRGWQAPPPPPPQVAQAVAPAAAPTAPPAPTGPPPLPFQFMGRMNDAGTQVVYLTHGEQTLLAHPGDTLETNYKVLAINTQHIEFEYLPSGEKQTLNLPASDN